MKLEIDDSVVCQNPGPDDISRVLSSLNGKNATFAALSRSDFTYIQAMLESEHGFAIEYQEGKSNRRYICSQAISLEKTIRAFQCYAQKDNAWKTEVPWEAEENLPKRGGAMRLPRIRFSASTWVNILCVAMCLSIVVVAGKAYGRKRDFWIGVFFAVAGVFIANMMTQIVRRGRFQSSGQIILKNENPIGFWLGVIPGYVMSAIFIIVAIVAIARGH